MCKDLKSLDITKKNLTFIIDALKNFIMMVDAIEKLRDACENKQYSMIANLLSAFSELSSKTKVSKYNNSGTYSNSKNLQNHMTFVNKSFSKPENIIKLLQLPDK
jgi:hypothetical protein